tara:strand:+ start:257 stop:466 length:210 start_codon:yes stop_codon:yes gene_type:complete
MEGDKSDKSDKISEKVFQEKKKIKNLDFQFLKCFKVTVTFVTFVIFLSFRIFSIIRLYPIIKNKKKQKF